MDHALRPRADDRRLVRDRSFALRRLTAPLRALPDFLIVGEMKCGTSSLFDHLRRHSLVAPPLRKELHYFGHGVRHGKGEGWYRAHFPRRARLRGGALTGEATPGYLYEPGAAERLAALIPRARLIVLLRDPVERAISHYYHELRMGREHLPIAEAMRLEETRLAEARAAGEEGMETLLHASYKDRGRYADSLGRLFRLFPREQVLVMDGETLFRDPAAAVTRVSKFLGLPAAEVPHLPARNRGLNREPVDPELRAELEEFFRPHQARLSALLQDAPAPTAGTVTA